MIETKRLLLREMTEEDVEALYRVLGDRDIPIPLTGTESVHGSRAIWSATGCSASVCGRSASKKPAK